MYFNMSCQDKIVNDLCLERVCFYEQVRDRNSEFFGYLNALSNLWEFLEGLADDFSVTCYKKGNDKHLAWRIVCHEQALKSVPFYNLDTEHLVKGILINTLQASLISWIRRFRRVEYEQYELKGRVVNNHDRLTFVECAYKAALYEYVRIIYNNLLQASIFKLACWYFLRMYCYKGMFRKNLHGQFTSPYGGLVMSPHLPDIEIECWRHNDLTSHLLTTKLESLNFTDFLVRHRPEKDDFIFVDPPALHTSAFSEFSFAFADHYYLANWLMFESKANWMVLFKPNRRIENLYQRSSCRAHVMYFSEDFKSRHFHRTDDVHNILVKSY